MLAFSIDYYGIFFGATQSVELFCTYDKYYAILVQKKDEEGRILEEHYLDENGNPTACWGYFGISYKHRKNEDILTYLDAKGKPMKTNAGYTKLVRSLDNFDQPLDDMYYDQNMNPVMCTGDYYGLHRKRDKEGFVREVIYLDADKSPIATTSGFAREKRSVDREGRITQRFYFDVAGNPVCLQLGQTGEAYTYDEYNRINQVTYLDKAGSPMVTTSGYTIMKRTYYRDGTEKTNQYFDSSGTPVALSKGQYGVQYTDNIVYYLNRNGRIKLCVDNLLNAYPVIVVTVGILLCIFLCLFPCKLKKVTLLAYILFIFYETLMFRETGNNCANLVLFSYAHTFLINWRIRVDVINNIWLFIPFGTGLYAIFQKKRVWVAALGLSLAIELIQYFTGLGILELDDLFGNTLGGVIGVGIGVLILHQCELPKKSPLNKFWG